MTTPDQKYWFPAKRYGWGWGPPKTWQGWVFLVSWIAVMTAGSEWLVARHRVLFGLFVAGMAAIMLAVGYAKGEPPRWRWGDDKHAGPADRR